MSSDQEDGIKVVPLKATRTELIRKAIQIYEDKLAAGEMKVSAGEYIRLLELLQQLDGDEPREIRVTWVDKRTETDTESSNDK
jgi:hypothetical protein